MTTAPKPALTEEQTNYLAEVVGHPASVSSALASVTAAAILSMFSGFGLAAVPVLFYLAGTSIAALFLPSSPYFREWIDRRKRAERRERQRQELTERIARILDARSPKREGFWAEVAQYGVTYQRMRDRLKSILELVSSRNASMSPYDLERLDDATVDYLRLVHARIALRERMEAQDEREINRKLELVERQLERADSAVEEKKLTIAAEELRRLVERRRALPARDAATAAQLLTMSEAFEDLYHQLSATGASAGTMDLGAFLHETAEKMRFEEEIGLEVDAELEAIERQLKAARAGQRANA